MGDKIAKTLDFPRNEVQDERLDRDHLMKIALTLLALMIGGSAQDGNPASCNS